MNIIKKLSENNLRFFIVIIVFIFLLLNAIAFENNMFSNRMTTDDCLWTHKIDSLTKDTSIVISQIIPGGVADQAGLKDGDILLEINDTRCVNTAVAMNELNKYRNEFIYYTILRGNEIFKINIWVYKFISISFLIFWIIGNFFLIIGSIVGYSKPKELTTRLFFFLSCAASVGLVMYSGTNPAGTIYSSVMSKSQLFLIYTINISFALGMAFMLPLYVHFFLTFPYKYNFKYRKLLIISAYLIVTILLTVRMLRIPDANQNIIIQIINYIPILYFGLGTAIFFISFKKVSDPILKKSFRIIRNGFVIGGVGLIYYFVFIMINTVPFFLINPLYLLPNALLLAIPISFGYSIIKYRILDTEFIVKRSLVFSIVTLLIIILYLALVFLMNSYLKEILKGNNQLLIITFIIIFVFSFDYVNKYAKEIIDKQIFRENYNYRKLLLNFSKEISYITKIEDLIKNIKEFLQKTVGIEIFSFRVLNDVYIKALDLSRDKEIDNILKKIIVGNKSEPIQLNSIDINTLKLTENEKYYLSNQKISLLIPVNLLNENIGVLIFGSKSSGKAFSEEDIDLLKSFASQSAICIENSRLNSEQLKHQKYEEEVNVALRIQNSLLPSTDFVHENLEIESYSEPAKIIGGDFYDIIKVSDDKVFVSIADVSDKGIPAALYMSQVQAMFQFATQILESPKEILSEINKQIYEQFDKFSFVTILIILFDFKNNLLKVARAGHTPLILVKDNTVVNLYTKGIGVGLKQNDFFENTVEEKVYNLNKGDMYFMYSDGLSEAMDVEKNLYGSERIENLLINNYQKSLPEIKELLLKDLSKFRKNAQINDDITFTLIKIK